MLEAIEEERVPDVVAAMEPDDAADMLQELSPEETANILEQMEEDEAEDVKELMEHERDSAGGIMTSEFVAVLGGSDRRARRLRSCAQAAAELPAENTFTVFAVDEHGGLSGVTNLRDILVADPDTPLSDIIQTDPVCGRTWTTTPRRRRAWWPSTTFWPCPCSTRACWPGSSPWTTRSTRFCRPTGESTCPVSARARATRDAEPVDRGTAAAGRARGAVPPHAHRSSGAGVSPQPHPAAAGRHRPGHHHLQRGQRPGRHHHLLRWPARTTATACCG